MGGHLAPLGLRLDWSDQETLLVVEVCPGILRDHNLANRQDLQVCAGDRILTVNRIQNNVHAMLEACEQAGPLALTIMRARECVVKVERAAAGNFGLGFRARDAISLEITRMDS